MSAPVLSQFVINAASGGTIAVAAAVAGKSTRLYQLILYSGGTTNITFQDGSTPLSGPIPLTTGGNVLFHYTGFPWYMGSVNTAFNIVASGSVQISGTAYFLQE